MYFKNYWYISLFTTVKSGTLFLSVAHILPLINSSLPALYLTWWYFQTSLCSTSLFHFSIILVFIWVQNCPNLRPQSRPTFLWQRFWDSADSARNWKIGKVLDPNFEYNSEGIPDNDLNFLLVDHEFYNLPNWLSTHLTPEHDKSCYNIDRPILTK